MRRFSVKTARFPEENRPTSQAERLIFTIFPPTSIRITVKDRVTTPLPSSVYRSAQPAWPESAPDTFWAVVFPSVEPTAPVLRPGFHAVGQNGNTLATIPGAASQLADTLPDG